MYIWNSMEMQPAACVYNNDKYTFNRVHDKIVHYYYCYL